jgi:anti-anti-sigma factor
MAIEDWSENTILVGLPDEPALGEELQRVTQFVQEQGHYDVVMDFTDVRLLNSSHLTALLGLQKLLQERGHRLVFCDVSKAIRGLLSVAGLIGVFEVTSDRFDALAAVTRPDSGKKT